MALKPNAKPWSIREQIIEDPAAGLTIQFEVNEQDSEAPYRFKIFGPNLPYGNREICFGQDGKEVAAGTLLVGTCRASWIREVG